MKKSFLSVFVFVLALSTILSFSGCLSLSSLSNTSQTESKIDYSSLRYSVDIDVSCRDNLALSRYDVDVFFNGNKLGTLKHGDSQVFSCRADEGTYTVKFAKKGANGVNGTIKAKIVTDTELSYHIHCHNDYIEVEALSVEADVEMNQDQVKTPISSKDLKYNKDYNDVVTMFEDAGFTNITTKANRDLIIGFLAEENELDNITIDGKDSFAEGEVFDKDAKVVITYHAWPEKEESSKQETSEEVVSKEESSKEESSKQESSKQESKQESSKQESKVESKTESSKAENKSTNVYTFDNCDDIKRLFSLSPETDAAEIENIISRYRGKTIELNMITYFVQNHGSYKTRFDYLLNGYHEETGTLSIPTYKIEDVNYYSLHLEGDNIPDSFGIGVYCKVRATMEELKDYCIIIKPISINVIKIKE